MQVFIVDLTPKPEFKELPPHPSLNTSLEVVDEC